MPLLFQAAALLHFNGGLMCKQRHRDVAEIPVWCVHKEYQVPLLSCPGCRRFPCRGLSEEMAERLRTSKFTEQICTGLQGKRMVKAMYILRMESGELRLAPREFDPSKPDFSMLSDVQEVLCVNKVLVKQMRLVVKSQDEIRKIRLKNEQEDVGISAENSEKPKGKCRKAKTEQ